MKKIYTLAAVILTGGVAFSQQVNPIKKKFSMPVETVLLDDKGMPAAKNHKVEYSAAKSAIIWKEDFNGGSLTTANGEWKQESLNPSYQYWEIDTVGQTWNVNNAAWKFTSPTNANGFALLDIGAKTNAATGGDLINKPAKVTLTSPSINLSASPKVKLKFFHSYRHCCNYQFDAFLDVSTDGGATFNTNNSFNLTAAIERNVFSGNVFNTVNLTSALENAADRSNVVLRFRWDSETPDPNNQTSDVYWWMIDDITIEDNPDVDLDLVQGFYGDPYYNFDFKQVPSSQVVKYPLGAQVRNRGNIPATFKLKARITGPNGFDSTYTGTEVTIGPDVDTNIMLPTFTKPNPGEYNITYSFEGATLGQDADPSNNTGTNSFNVTRNLYSHDPGTWNGTSAFEHIKVAGEYAPYRIGLYYQGFAPGQVFAVNTIFASTAANPIPAGQQVLVDFYRMLDATPGNYDPDYPTTTATIDLTDEDITTPGETPKVVHINFDQPGPLEAGDLYFIQFSITGGPTEAVNFAESGESNDNSTLIFGPFGGGGETWYRTSSAPIMRLVTALPNTDAVNKTEAAAFTLGQSVPNPTNGTTRIDYNLTQTGTVSFNVVDITGKAVVNNNLGTIAAGAHNITMDAAQFNAGIYFYTLTVDGKSITKKMIITE